MLPYTSIFVAGHQGMVGSAVVRLLGSRHPHVRIICRSRQQLNLEDPVAVRQFMDAERPEAIIYAAAKVGGIHANKSYPVEFLSQNLQAQLTTINAAYEFEVKRFLFLGSTCIYPRLANQPITEEQLLSSPLEETNEAYALAKICGLKLCQYYRKQYGRLFHSAMPTNIYGPGDNYHPENSHVLPALIRRFHEAKVDRLPEVAIWGTGKPLREFLHVDDLARGLLHLLQVANPPDWANVGTGQDLSIGDLARLVADVVGYSGALTFDASKPDGTPRKLTDISKMRTLGWEPEIELTQGVRSTYQDFLQRLADGSMRSAR